MGTKLAGSLVLPLPLPLGLPWFVLRTKASSACLMNRLTPCSPADTGADFQCAHSVPHGYLERA